MKLEDAIEIWHNSGGMANSDPTDERVIDVLHTLAGAYIDGLDEEEPLLQCGDCGLTNEKEPTVLQRCCAVRCADCQQKAGRQP